MIVTSLLSVYWLFAGRLLVDRIDVRCSVPARRLVQVSTRPVGKAAVSGGQAIWLYPGGCCRSSPVLLTYLVKSAHPSCDGELLCGPGGD